MPEQTRQLAAIMFTDIVGYTAFMGKDEQKAFDLLRKNRQIQRPLIEKFNGRWIKEIGDGVLASFSTVTDAVRCAIEIQQACLKLDDLTLRIGIHLGEVVFEDDDVFGDGVNIASRLQAVANPGGVFVSETVHQNLSNKGLQTRFVREERLKNVKDAVKIYELVTTSSHSSQTKQNNRPGQKTVRKLTRYGWLLGLLLFLLVAGAAYFFFHSSREPEKSFKEKWLAILPFRLITGDSNMEWLSDGFTEELTSSVAGISNLKVKSPTTMLQYKGSKKSIKEIGHELNVTSIVDGSIQKEENNFIINARLINPLTEEILKNFRIKKDASEIRAIYSEVAQQIAEILDVTLTSEESKRLLKPVKVDPELYNLYLQGMAEVYKFNPQSDREAVRIFDNIIRRDSTFAPAFTGKAFAVVGLSTWFASIPREEAIAVSGLYDKSLSLDSNLGLTYSAKGWADMCLKWDFKSAEKDLLKAFSIDPSDEFALSGLLFVYMFTGNHRESLKWWATGKVISPRSWWVDAGHGMTLYLVGKAEEAIQFNNDGIANYDHILFYDKLGWLYDLTNKNEEAITILETELRKFNVRPPSTLAWLASSYFKAGNKNKAQEILNELEKRVSENAPNTAVYLAMAYASIGNKDQALTLLDKAHQLHDVDMIWLKEEPHFKSLHNEARYKQLLIDVGF
jgi:adenylate cyclase